MVLFFVKADTAAYLIVLFQSAFALIKTICVFFFKGKGVSFPPSAAISAYTFYQTAPLSVLDGVDGALSRDAHYGQEAADKGDKHAYAED